MTRFFAATALAFLPIFTANLVFTSRFKETGHIATAFGANLLGAMFGGLGSKAFEVLGPKLAGLAAEGK